MYNQYLQTSTDTDIPVREIETEATLRRRRRYVRGPLPLAEVCAAARLPGKALAVWLLAHHRMRITGKTMVTLPSSLLEEAGIDRNAKARALSNLERNGLVEVRRQRGRTPLISLVGLPASKCRGPNGELCGEPRSGSPDR